MEDNRLNLDAPLLSVRRRFSAPPAVAAKKKPPLLPSPSPRRSSLPLYKPELNSTPARARGVVPFAWENAPGQPKRSPRTAVRRGFTPDQPPVPPKPPPGSTGRVRNGLGSKIGESSDDDDDDDDDEDEDEQHKGSNAVQLRSKSCRLIPKLWSKIPNCFLNPIAMRIRSCLPRPRVKTLQFEPLRHENVNSWEAVYGYRLGSCDSKLRSESNWSDSGTHEGSSSFRHSDTTGLMDFIDEDFEVVVDRLRAKQSHLIDHCEANAVIPKLSDPFTASDRKLLCEEMNVNDVGVQGILDDSLVLKADGAKEMSNDSLALSVLPPPLPKSPSESWLLRAVSSKNRPPPQSLLAMQFQLRSQSFRDLSIKSSKMSSRSLRFAEFIAKPTSPQSAS